jgi:hypothetical protein
MKIRNLAVERDGAPDQRDRLLVAPARVSERAGKMQRMHVPRLGREHLGVEAVGFGELAGLMVANGGNEGVGLHAGTEARTAGEINPARLSVPASARIIAKQAPFGPADPIAPRSEWLMIRQ